MFKLRRVNIEGSKELFTRIRDFVIFLKKTLPVREVYLFGSFAKNEIHEGSDIDLLIIGDFKERFFDRIGNILDLLLIFLLNLSFTRPKSLRNLNNLKIHSSQGFLKPL
jgi:hypothetical protein